MAINRHDILVFFDVTNGNPNGNPDAGNMPRIEPNTGKGLVSDVCLKRKVRNFVAQFAPQANGDNSNQFGILVQQGNILNREIERAVERSTHAAGLTAIDPARMKQGAELKKRAKQLKKDAKTQMDRAEEMKREAKSLEEQAKQLTAGASDNERAEHAMRWLCRIFYDVRTFGAVLSTGEDVLKGSAFGQVRGPVQFTFGMSLDPIPTQEVTITRCAVTKEEDAAKERTMGNKHIVPYGLYMAKAFVSPIFAERTRFDDADLALFFDALKHLFSHDQSAARAEMTVRAIYDFEHVGTQAPTNPGQNKREALLGCAPAHKLFEQVTFKRTVESKGPTFPASFADYDPIDGWKAEQPADGMLTKYPGVKLNRIVVP